jgi:hypothetical protein
VATVIGIAGSLRAADERWARLSTKSVWSATAIVTVTWSLIALDRLGGLALTEPRAFARLAVIGIWGWLALGLSVFAAVRVSAKAAAPDARVRSVVSLERVLSVVGWAHVPVMALAVVVFISAGALQILGPGLVVAAVVFAVAVPFALVTGVRHIAASSIMRAIAIVAIPYAVWLLVVIRHALDSIQHLL